MSLCRAHAARRPVLAAALLIGVCLGTIPADTDARPVKPNIVLILTDDEDVGIHAFMPKTKALLEDQGTTFANFFVSYPWCCPSRATILRGQYAHNTGIVGNEPPWGGFEKFRGRGLEESTIATWLQAAGYSTAMVGKYINRYVPEKDGVPPGWDEWYVGGNAHPSYDYASNENGRIVAYGDRPEDIRRRVARDSDVRPGRLDVQQSRRVIRARLGAVAWLWHHHSCRTWGRRDRVSGCHAVPCQLRRSLAAVPERLDAGLGHRGRLAIGSA